MWVATLLGPLAVDIYIKLVQNLRQSEQGVHVSGQHRSVFYNIASITTLANRARQHDTDAFHKLRCYVVSTRA